MMQWDFRMSSDIRLILKLPDQFNVGVLRSVVPEMVTAVYQQPKSLREIVASSGNSYKTIEREFRENIDCFPSNFLNILRVGVCGALLLWHNELSIDGIASVCGFSTGITLRRQFKRLTGINPTEFKQVVEGGDRLPSMDFGRLKIRWNIPRIIRYNASGTVETPLTYIVSWQG